MLERSDFNNSTFVIHKHSFKNSNFENTHNLGLKEYQRYHHKGRD